MSRFLEGCPEAVQRLHLQKPGWLEASAGSGKTYAIEHLVVRLLRETPDLSLSQILLVTFTEKAAGELKEKIRRRIDSACRESITDPIEKLRLQNARLHFDQASVFTIHAFCMQSLRRYAFEMRGLFEATVHSEKAARDTAILNLFRQATRGKVSNDLTEALVECASAPFKSKLQSISLRYRPLRGDTLWPQLNREHYATCEARFREALDLTVGWLFPAGTKSLADAPWMQSLLQVSKGRKDKFDLKSRNRGFEKWWESYLKCGDSLEAWRQVFKSGTTKLVKDRGALFQFDSELNLPPDLEGWMQQATLRVNGLFSAFFTWHQANIAEQYRPLIAALNALAEGMENQKTDQGWLTYDDMAWRLWSALQSSPELIALLQQQFPIAIVDEFQDTDPVQWGIFESLYLQNQPPKPLFLVGDPKQAIYGFRGGDLQTYLRARQQLQSLSQNNQAMGLSLPANFRSRQDLIEACNTLFAHEDWFRTEVTETPRDNWELLKTQNRITFVPALFGNAPKQICQDSSDYSAPIWFLVPQIDTQLQDHKEIQQQIRAQWDYGMALGIRKMLTQANGMRIPDEAGALRPLNPGDICVLYRNHKDRLGIEKWLRQWEIPYHIYRQRGLFKSFEAGHLAAILNALARPQDPKSQIAAHFCELLPTLERPHSDDSSLENLISTPSISLHSDDIESVDRLEVMHPQLQALLPLAQQLKWAVFFRRLFKSSGLEPNSASQEIRNNSSSAKEKWSRYQQLSQRLCEAAHIQGLNCLGLAQCLQDLRKSDEEDFESEGDTLRPADSIAKVTFLTMHASKGLEFPVVFIAGSLGKSQVDAKRLRHEQGLGWTWYLNTPNSSGDGDANEFSNGDSSDWNDGAETNSESDSDGNDADPMNAIGGESIQEQWAAETAQEDRRLFYVALTRAQFKLVLPFFPDTFPTKKEIHSPWKGFVGAAMRSAQAKKPQLFALREIDPLLPAEPEGLERYQPPFEGYDSLPNQVNSQPKVHSLPPLSLSPLESESASYQWRRRGLASYSQLAHRRQQMVLDEQGKRLEPDEVNLPGEISISTPLSASTSNPNSASGLSLPAGARTGNFLHACMELLDFKFASDSSTFDVFKQGPAKELIEKQLKAYELDPSLAPEAARIIWNTLRTPLPDLKNPPATFRLADISERLPELEFMLPFGKSEPLPDMRSAGGYLWGYIDLVFRKGDAYYLLDWKSNTLPDYSPKSLTESMEKEAYDLQGRLYALALHRWLQGRLQLYQPEIHFGGVFYLYMRGLKGDMAIRESATSHAKPISNSPHFELDQNGIAAWKPTREDLEKHYPIYLSTYLGVASEALQSNPMATP